MTKHRSPITIVTLCAIEMSAFVEVRLAYAAAGDIDNLGTLGGTSSAGYDINDAGQVVGYANDGMGRSRAFLWASNQGMTDLGAVNGYTEARAYGISSSGSVVGVEFDDVAAVSHAFAWAPNEPNSTTGAMTNLARRDYSTATGINTAGDIVGSSTWAWFVEDGSCTPDHPYYPSCGPGGTWHYETSAGLWENGVGTDLTSPGFTLETASAINNAGQVTGQTDAGHAFRFDGDSGRGIVQDLGTLGGATSIGNAINDDGEVVGESWTTGNDTVHAFRYVGTPGAGGMMVDLGALGGKFSHADDVNNAGLVVGYAGRSDGERTATLWLNDAGNTAVDLDTWLDAINPNVGAYWMLVEARGINSSGFITGLGAYDDGPGGLSDGYRAFVLDATTFVPVPSIVGDFNADGAVNAADYVVWRKTGGTQDGYNLWRANFGQPSGAGSSLTVADLTDAAAVVPECPALVLLLSGTILGLVGRRKAKYL